MSLVKNYDCNECECNSAVNFDTNCGCGCGCDGCGAVPQDSEHHTSEVKAQYRFSFDEDSGAGYVKFSNNQVASTIHVGPLYVDFDPEGVVVGVEWFGQNT